MVWFHGVVPWCGSMVRCLAPKHETWTRVMTALMMVTPNHDSVDDGDPQPLMMMMMMVTPNPGPRPSPGCGWERTMSMSCCMPAVSCDVVLIFRIFIKSRFRFASGLG